MTDAIPPRLTQVFRFVRCSYADGVAELVYAFDQGEELIERVRFPHAPPVFAPCQQCGESPALVRKRRSKNEKATWTNP